jgi:DNA-binding response OmpR family regulator
MKVLVVEDNLILSRNLVKYLITRDIFVEASYDGKDWLYKAATKHYDVIILDINLPEMDWLEVCKQIRERWKDASILMLTSRGTNEDIVNGLELWADDYLVKPFEYSELLARMNAIYRRKMKNSSNRVISLWNIELNIEQLEVKKDWKIIKLSKLEYNLFKYLAQNKWKALSREEIYKTVWWEFDGDFMFSKTIDVYIWYLRKKLWKDLIETKKAYWFLIK